jgi:branched-subunit amino acid ABC-type transport system permease component
MSSPASRRAPWPNYAAGLWSILFGAPHTWWAFGITLGFPGGAENHRFFMSTWRYWYNVAVIVCSVLGVIVAIGLVRPWGARLRPALKVLAWIAAVLLSLRGLAGLIVDGTRDPVWWPTFLAGGVKVP